MGKKKPGVTGDGPTSLPAPAELPAARVANGAAQSASAPPQQQDGLTICRNKHWRFISAFHGAWLQLPHELLENLAHGNFLSPRPRQAHPGALFDVLKIRKLVDEASDLAVRAQNGTASSALSTTGDGIPGSSLGFTSGRGNGNAMLSPERRQRMRELAVQKLSQAYRLDEIAASVAMMQCTSALDNVAQMVLQRAPKNADAKYVYFFHEKIPSRMVAEYSPLEPLNELIAIETGHAAPLRTRATIRVFKEDYQGAVHDLTEALAIYKLDQTKAMPGPERLMAIQIASEELERHKTWSKAWLQNNKIADDDQEKGLEMQLLFQRGSQYLSIACQNVRKALRLFVEAGEEKRRLALAINGEHGSKQQQNTEAGHELYRRALDAREAVRRFAKRALRDYTTFFTRLDYAYGESSPWPSDPKPIASVAEPTPAGKKPPLTVYDLATVLSAAPPGDLPPSPPPLLGPGEREPREIITYHPLMPEAIHSALLAHCLLQTAPTTLLRHAHNVARVARRADGLPFFAAARSPARADWVEIVRKAQNWIGLTAPWDTLCKPPRFDEALEMVAKDERANPQNRLSLATAARTITNPLSPMVESPTQRRQQIHKNAVLEALGDERVVDDITFQRSVQARERRAMRELEASRLAASSRGQSNAVHIDSVLAAKDEEYVVGTERAEAIAKWVLEAPLEVEGAPAKSRAKKSKKPKSKPPPPPPLPTSDDCLNVAPGVDGGMEELSVK